MINRIHCFQNATFDRFKITAKLLGFLLFMSIFCIKVTDFNLISITNFIVRIIVGIISGTREEVFSIGSVFDQMKTRRICLEFCFAPPRTFAVLCFENPLETREEIWGFEMLKVVFLGGQMSEGTGPGWDVCWSGRSQSSD